ncbi:unnamed protein product [Zymoseptoria tritici ST99CH_1A5]|uniref:Uncharacterized protein n=1 Tax=Zymoseptoria tritici ST99CH_1A5 TaxID=1276529 RepID=A0A1Y6L928_ZYMTR|nr:unnamed protein product [Zymoseptoria tritici ST99CH_1A5]
MSTEITLFDLPSKGTPTCWSLNPWKARMVLNFKKLPYKTEWVEYPDLASTFKSFEIAPNAPPQAEYTSPVVRLPNGRYIMESRAIARELEELKPEPSIQLDSPYVQKTFDLLGQIWPPLRSIVLPRVPIMLLPPRSAEYFERTREEQFGKPLAEVAKTDGAGEGPWQEAEKGFQGIRALLAENEGPYVLGKEASFADFVLAGLWRMLERVDRDGDVYGRIMKDETFQKHHDACRQWQEKDD